MIGPKSIEDLIGNANALGAMQASAIWALMFILLAIRTWLAEKHYQAYDRQWQDIRIKEAEGDIKIAEAVRSLAEVVEKQHEQLTEIRIIIDERLHRGGA